MRKLAILTTGLLVLGFASAKAKGEKTNDAKTTDAVASPSESKTTTGVNYYWFDVSTDGTTLSDPSNGIPASQPATASGDCGGTQMDYCQRGFTDAQTTVSSGKRTVKPSVDIENSPGEDHKQ